MITSSAPGKIILFGEHAVVYGRPALAVPVTQVQATVEVDESPRPGIWIEAPDIRLSCELSQLPLTHPLAAAINGVLTATGISTPSPFTIHVHSTIPVASGLGSGAAVSVALIRALSSAVGRLLSDEQVNALAYEIEKLHHGTPSGIDNTVITYSRPVVFVTGARIETLQVGMPFTLVIGDTGVSAPTKESVFDVRQLWQMDRRRWGRVFNRIGEIVQAARRAIEIGDLPVLGPLMDDNHALLQELTVSSPGLDHLVDAARGSGALGAKLSGGGRGGNMIALVRPQEAERVAAALLAAGAKRALITAVQAK